MYSFAQRMDTVVFDEPLYAAYLSNSKAINYHPGAKEIIAEKQFCPACGAKQIEQQYQPPGASSMN